MLRGTMEVAIKCGAYVEPRVVINHSVIFCQGIPFRPTSHHSAFYCPLCIESEPCGVSSLLPDFYGAVVVANCHRYGCERQ